MASSHTGDQYSPGQKLLVTLRDKTILEGILSRYSRKGIILHEVSFVPSNGKSFEQLELRNHEISNCSPTGEIIQRELGEIKSMSTPAQEDKRKEPLYEKLKSVVENLVFINEVGLKFSEAVKDIQNFQCVSLVGEGSSKGRFGNLSLLSLATSDAVYLFDIIQMGQKAFRASDSFLRKFLQSKEVLKVVHNCRSLSDCLKHGYGITLHNVFDTQACHIIVEKNRSGHPPASGKFSDIVAKYLKLPSVCDNPTFDDPNMWRRRPLLDGMTESSAWRACLLRQLKPRMDDALYAPFENLCDFYLKSVRDELDTYKAEILIQQDEIKLPLD